MLTAQDRQFPTLAADTDNGGGLSAPKPDSDLSPEQILLQLDAGNSVDLSHLNRGQRLGVINNFLSSQNLRALEGLGDASRGEMEFVGINKFSPDRFVARLDFETVVGEGEKQAKFNHLNFITSNTALGDGVVTVPLISVADAGSEQYVVLVRQFRPVLGRGTIELARGFPNPDDFLDSKPMKAALRELEEETGIVSDRGNTFDIQEMKPVYENTGTHNVRNSIFKISITVTSDEMEKMQRHVTVEPSGHKVQTLLVPVDTAFKLLEDNHSLAALARCVK